MSTVVTDIRTSVRHYILNTFVYDEHEAENLTNDLKLIDEGILDSYGVYELLLFLEGEFSIDIKDEEVITRNFESIDAITSFIESKL